MQRLIRDTRSTPPPSPPHPPPPFKIHLKHLLLTWQLVKVDHSWQSWQTPLQISHSLLHLSLSSQTAFFLLIAFKSLWSKNTKRKSASMQNVYLEIFSQSSCFYELKETHKKVSLLAIVSHNRPSWKSDTIQQRIFLIFWIRPWSIWWYHVAHSG